VTAGFVATVVERRFGAFPARLSVADGPELMTVEAVERCWTEKLDDRGGFRYHYQVRCEGRRLRLTEESGRSTCTVQFA